MQIEYEISEQDFIDAQRLAIKNSSARVVRWLFPLFGLAMLAFLVNAGIEQGVSWRFLPGLLFSLFFISIPLLRKRELKRVYAKNTAMHGRLSLAADEDGLRFQGPTFSSQIGWQNFSRFFEDEKSFVIYHNSRVFNPVPKRSLAPEQIKTLREYLERKIGRQA